MSAPTVQPGIPALPHGARELVKYEPGGQFLGWTCYTFSRFARRLTWHFIRPEGTPGERCTSRVEAVNHLRGPAGLPALVTDED